MRKAVKTGASADARIREAIDAFNEAIYQPPHDDLCESPWIERLAICQNFRMDTCGLVRHQDPLVSIDVLSDDRREEDLLGVISIDLVNSGVDPKLKIVTLFGCVTYGAGAACDAVRREALRLLSRQLAIVLRQALDEHPDVFPHERLLGTATAITPDQLWDLVAALPEKGRTRLPAKSSVH